MDTRCPAPAVLLRRDGSAELEYVPESHRALFELLDA